MGSQRAGWCSCEVGSQQLGACVHAVWGQAYREQRACGTGILCPSAPSFLTRQLQQRAPAAAATCPRTLTLIQRSLFTRFHASSAATAAAAFPTSSPLLQHPTLQTHLVEVQPAIQVVRPRLCSLRRQVDVKVDWEARLLRVHAGSDAGLGHARASGARTTGRAAAGWGNWAPGLDVACWAVE